MVVFSFIGGYLLGLILGGIIIGEWIYKEDE